MKRLRGKGAHAAPPTAQSGLKRTHCHSKNQAVDVGSCGAIAGGELTAGFGYNEGGSEVDADARHDGQKNWRRHGRCHDGKPGHRGHRAQLPGLSLLALAAAACYAIPMPAGTVACLPGGDSGDCLTARSGAGSQEFVGTVRRQLARSKSFPTKPLSSISLQDRHRNNGLLSSTSHAVLPPTPEATRHINKVLKRQMSSLEDDEFEPPEPSTGGAGWRLQPAWEGNHDLRFGIFSGRSKSPSADFERTKISCDGGRSSVEPSADVAGRQGSFRAPESREDSAAGTDVVSALAASEAEFVDVESKEAKEKQPQDGEDSDKAQNEDLGFGRIDSQPDENEQLGRIDTQDLAINVAELCQQGRGEAALELVRTDLRNMSQPLCTDIMLAFAEAGLADCAQGALLHMQTLCVETGESLDAQTFNALMLAYARDAATATDEGLDQAFSLLEIMLKAQIDPDLTTYHRLMEACSAASETVEPFSKGLQVLDAMNEGKRVEPDVDIFNTMLEACGKRGWSTSTGDGLRVGSKILTKMAEEDVVPTVDTFNILMYGCAWAAGAGDGWVGVEQGLGFLAQMADLSVMPDVITFNNLIAACAQAAGNADGPLSREQAFQLLNMMQAIGLAPDQGTCDTLIATCAKTAAAGDALGVTYGIKVLGLVHEWHLPPDPSMYKSLFQRCLTVAQTSSAGYPLGWNGVRWMSNILALMAAFRLDGNSDTRDIYTSLASLVTERSLALASCASVSDALPSTPPAPGLPVDADAVSGEPAADATAADPASQLVSGADGAFVAAAYPQELANEGEAGGGQRVPEAEVESAAVPFDPHDVPHDVWRVDTRRWEEERGLKEERSEEERLLLLKELALAQKEDLKAKYIERAQPTETVDEPASGETVAEGVADLDHHTMNSVGETATPDTLQDAPETTEGKVPDDDRHIERDQGAAGEAVLEGQHQKTDGESGEKLVEAEANVQSLRCSVQEAPSSLSGVVVADSPSEVQPVHGQVQTALEAQVCMPTAEQAPAPTPAACGPPSEDRADMPPQAQVQPPLSARQGSESDATIYTLSSSEEQGTAGARESTCAGRVPVEITPVCMAEEGKPQQGDPLRSALEHTNFVATPQGVREALAVGTGEGVAAGEVQSTDGTRWAEGSSGSTPPEIGVTTPMVSSVDQIRTQAGQSFPAVGISEGAGRVGTTRSRSTGILDGQAGAAGGLGGSGWGGTVEQMSLQLSNQFAHAPPMHRQHMRSASVAVRGAGGGLRLKGMGAAGAGVLDYSSLGIPAGEIRKMTSSHVVEWLRMVGLEDVVAHFREAGIDGPGLLQLRQLSVNEADAFYSTVESRLGIKKFGHVLRLADCLQCL